MMTFDYEGEGVWLMIIDYEIKKIFVFSTSFDKILGKFCPDFQNSLRIQRFKQIKGGVCTCFVKLRATISYSNNHSLSNGSHCYLLQVRMASKAAASATCFKLHPKQLQLGSC